MDIDINNTFFMADPHFNHSNIIKYCNRPFSSTGEMNDTLIDNCNALVPENGTLYILGDLGWPDPTECLRRINCRNIVLIRGNHDDTKLITRLLEEGVLSAAYHYMTLPLGKYWQHPLVMMHYPIESWDRKYREAIHIHGHTHGTLNNAGLLRYDMGVDCHNYFPVSLANLLKAARKDLAKIGGREGILASDKLSARRDTEMLKLHNAAEADIDKFLAEYQKYKKFYEQNHPSQIEALRGTIQDERLNQGTNHD